MYKSENSYFATFIEKQVPWCFVGEVHYAIKPLNCITLNFKNRIIKMQKYGIFLDLLWFSVAYLLELLHTKLLFLSQTIALEKSV